MKVTPHENFFAIQIHVYGCIGFQPLYICICIHTNVYPGEYRYVNVHVEVAPLRHEDRIYLTRCVQLFVSVGEMFWDRRPGHAVVQHVGKHSSTSHSNDEAEDTFPQAEWLESHHPLPAAASPTSNTSIFPKSER